MKKKNEIAKAQRVPLLKLKWWAPRVPPNASKIACGLPLAKGARTAAKAIRFIIEEWLSFLSNDSILTYIYIYKTLRAAH